MTNGWSNAILEGHVSDAELSSNPTNRLMLAVLEEALVTFQKGLGASGARDRHHTCEVERWVSSTDGNLLFSFENICSSLKIDPEYVRDGLKHLKAATRQDRNGMKCRGLRRERMYDRRAWRGHIG